MKDHHDVVRVVIAIDDTHRDRLAEVIQRLRAAGMHVQQSLDNLGVVTGSIASWKIQTLAHIEGVSNVEIERTHQLPPAHPDHA